MTGDRERDEPALDRLVRAANALEPYLGQRPFMHDPALTQADNLRAEADWIEERDAATNEFRAALKAVNDRPPTD